MNSKKVTKRLIDNERVIDLLQDFLRSHPDIRWCQMLGWLEGKDEDNFYEEPDETFERYKSRLPH